MLQAVARLTLRFHNERCPDEAALMIDSPYFWSCVEPASNSRHWGFHKSEGTRSKKDGRSGEGGEVRNDGV